MEDQFNTFFKNTNFDIEKPNLGHLQRFEKKLNKTVTKKPKISYKWMSVAASIILLIGFWLGSNQTKQTLFLADVSPEMHEAETFFVSTISSEIKEIEKIRSPKTEKIISDALLQLKKLEDNYKDLVTELNKSNNDRRVVYAMISNYQNRIEILQNTLKQIDEVNNIKENQNEEIYI